MSVTKTESPLSKWWRHHDDPIDRACMDAAGSVDDARQLKDLLARAARGDVSIDDWRLRMVAGYLALAAPNVHTVLSEHRRWELELRGTP